MGQASTRSSAPGFCTCHARPEPAGEDEENALHVRGVVKGEALGKANIFGDKGSTAPTSASGSPAVSPSGQIGGWEGEEVEEGGCGGGRRRLSVVSGGNGMSRTGSIDFAKEEITLLHAEPNDAVLLSKGFTELFQSERLRERRAVSLYSMTDTEGCSRASFKEKCEEVIIPPGRDSDESMLIDWLTELGFGWACKKGLKDASPNQDSFSILAVEDEFILVGVYDGHGSAGHDVSQFVRERIVKLFLMHAKRKTDVKAALTDAFLQCQAAIEAGMPRLRAMESGTTCTLVHIDFETQQLAVAHVGDARAALGKRRRPEGGTSEEVRLEVDDLTTDHKPNLPEERERIENADPPGRVLFDGCVNYRVFAQDGLYPGLNMSRALGDVTGHRMCGLTAEPDVHIVDLRPLLSEYADLTLFVCTDGVWEFIKTEEAFKLASEVPGKGPRGMVSKLCGEAYRRWMADSDGEVTDDITAVCLHLHEALRRPRSQGA